MDVSSLSRKEEHRKHLERRVRMGDRVTSPIVRISRIVVEPKKSEPEFEGETFYPVSGKARGHFPDYSFIISRMGRISIQNIQAAVCAAFGIRRVELLARRRTNEVVIPRQIAIYIARKHTTCSYPMIAKHFGGMDHTTILHAVRKMSYLESRDQSISAEIAAIEIALGVGGIA